MPQSPIAVNLQDRREHPQPEQIVKPLAKQPAPACQCEIITNVESQNIHKNKAPSRMKKKQQQNNNNKNKKQKTKKQKKNKKKKKKTNQGLHCLIEPVCSNALGKFGLINVFVVAIIETGT